MQRWLMAAVLLAGADSVARADYFIIKVNLASTKDKKPEDPNNQLAEQGGGSGLMPGANGNGLGVPGTGGLGMGAGPGVPGGLGGPGIGGGGLGAGPGVPGGMRGGRGGMGAGQFGARGGAGALGAGPGLGGPDGGILGGRGGMGAGGKLGGVGIQGGAGMGFQGGGMSLGGALGGPGMKGPAGASSILNQILGDDEDKDSAPLFVGAIVEVRHEDVKLQSTGRYRIKHKWGATTLFVDANDNKIEIVPVPIFTVAQQYAKEKIRLKGVDLALWALAHGLYDEVPKIMTELQTSDPKNPISVVFQKTEAALAKDVKADDSSLKWRDKLGEFKEERSKHYVLCYDGTRPDQIKQRLRRLEDNMRGFYYWFALHGKALPVPEKRLVAVLVDNKDNFKAKHKDIFDDEDLVSDGFYNRRENIAVFSSFRLDNAYEALEKTTGPLWATRKYSPSELLAGKGGSAGVPANELAYVQTLTLLQKAMQEESEWNSVSFEGTRQLLESVGFLPKNVEVPKWFDFGFASLFEVPKGAFWVGTGSQNQTYVAQFQIWNTEKKLDKPADALMGVVTDRYFRRVAEAKNKENSENKARTMTWSLIRYLAQKKLDGLINYSAELQQLPRDLELNEEVLALAFARAFNLCEAGNPDKIDQNKMNMLANDWFKSMNSEVLEVTEVKNLQRKIKPPTGKPGEHEKETKPGDPGSYIP